METEKRKKKRFGKKNVGSRDAMECGADKLTTVLDGGGERV
jgi:hypothetical protein